MALVDSAGFLAYGGEASCFAVFHRVGADPVDSSVTTDSVYISSVVIVHTVLRIHHDNLVVFVRRILVNPVRVQNSQIGTFATNTFLRRRSQRTLVLQLIDSLVRLQ
jgi:hypothetical protein